MTVAHALHSLYGGKAKRNALAGNVGGQEREQTVLTPEWFTSQLGPIALDPCTIPSNPVKATYFATAETPAVGKLQTGRFGLLAGGYTGELVDVTGGLALPWHKAPGTVFVNPPFNDLELWLWKCRREWELGARIYLLGPFRPHRTWFCEALEGILVQSLRSFPFVGSKDPFPAPLFVATFGACPAPGHPGLPVVALVGPANAKGEIRSLVTGEWGLAA